MRRVGVLDGVGSHVPATHARVGPGESMSDLAVTAATTALAAGNGSGPRVDLVLLVTAAPNRGGPATAQAVARELGLGTVSALDMASVGSGFVYGLAVVDGMIAAGKVRRVLLIGVDMFATAFDPAAASLFGDGAGALVLRAGDADEPGAVLGFDLGNASHSAGRTAPRQPERQAVHQHAVDRMTASARAAMHRAGWGASEVDRLIAHQANAAVVAAVGAELGIDRLRIYENSNAAANSVAASVPLALTDAAAAGDLRAGAKVLVSAFGGGGTWGAAALTWPGRLR